MYRNDSAKCGVNFPKSITPNIKSSKFLTSNVNCISCIYRAGNKISCNIIQLQRYFACRVTQVEEGNICFICSLWILVWLTCRKMNLELFLIDVTDLPVEALATHIRTLSILTLLLCHTKNDPVKWIVGTEASTVTALVCWCNLPPCC